MNSLTSLGVSVDDSDSEDEALLHACDAGVVTQVRRYFSRIRFSKWEDLDALYQDECQEVRFALWKVSRKGPLHKPASLIRVIVRNRARDACRRLGRRPQLLPLEREQPEVLALSEQRAATNEGARDPAYECELRDFPEERLALYIQAIQSLSAGERKAVLWCIREHGLELRPVIAALRKAGLDPEQVPSPQSQAELKRYRAALSAARRRLREPLGV
ncbi:sigma-70 family RNA polymerase sigma factor [Thermogemmatispora carboxidivorans]|uniref:sigma-70 family RNA polymerase sigma factor n=1 Tax=Thermogemmatispora carboxidivorans TaxID=1382306 RepID=UPI00069BA552|nr:sigma-70 family RNA polymerase sigma factor [Thermogemmatispora carboxidivorans]